MKRCQVLIFMIVWCWLVPGAFGQEKEDLGQIHFNPLKNGKPCKAEIEGIRYRKGDVAQITSFGLDDNNQVLVCFLGKNGQECVLPLSDFGNADQSFGVIITKKVLSPAQKSRPVESVVKKPKRLPTPSLTPTPTPVLSGSPGEVFYARHPDLVGFVMLVIFLLVVLFCL